MAEQGTPDAREGGVRASLSLLRRNRDFRRAYLSSMISLGGDWFLLVALFGLVLDRTDSALAVAFLLAAQDLTYFVVSPFMGLLADGLDRKRLMVVADVGRAVLCIGFLFTQTESTWWLVYPLLAAMACFSAAFEPASAAALPNLVDGDDLATANALSGSLWGTMLTIGAALGGIVTAVVGRDAAIAFDAASFVCSALLILRIRRSFQEARIEETPARLREAATQTLRYARRDHRVLALLAVKFGWGLAGGVLVLVPLLADHRFHAGEVGVGLLLAARGLGALIGPFVGRAALGTKDRRLFLTIGIALGVFGAGYVLLGLAPGLLLALPAVMIAHTGGGSQWMLSSYGLQKIVLDHIRGRIFAFDGMLVTLTFGVSSLVTGWLAEVIGAQQTAVVMGGVAVLWAAVWMWLTTDVRRATLMDGCGGPPPDSSVTAIETVLAD
ncbi:MAG: MFS transporter [Actinomycetota bacterium]